MARKKQCPCCHKNRNMTKHHVFPRRFFKDFEGMIPCIYICRACHQKLETLIPLHNKQSEWEYLKMLFHFLHREGILEKNSRWKRKSW